MKYPMFVLWSEPDQQFIALCPDFPIMSAFGDTRAKALAEGEVALQLFLDEAKEKGEPLPVLVMVHGSAHAKALLAQFRPVVDSPNKSGVRREWGDTHSVAEPACSCDASGHIDLSGLADMFWLFERDRENVEVVHLPIGAEADVTKWAEGADPRRIWSTDVVYDEKDNKVLLVGEHGTTVHGIWRAVG